MALTPSKHSETQTITTRAVESITASGGYIGFASGRNVISAAITISDTYCPLIVTPVNPDRGYVYVDRTGNSPYPIKPVVNGTTYTVIYRYVPNSITT